jgi:hypothetical protein
MGTGGSPPLTDFHLFLYLKRYLAGKNFDSDDELKESAEKWLTPVSWPTSMNRTRKTLCPVMTSASMWVELISKCRLRYVEFDSNEYKFFTSSRCLL